MYAYDDAINVGGDNPVGIEINGGKIFAFAGNNDGIDSNGKLWVNGGPGNDGWGPGWWN